MPCLVDALRGVCRSPRGSVDRNLFVTGVLGYLPCRSPRGSVDRNIIGSLTLTSKLMSLPARERGSKPITWAQSAGGG